MNVTLDNAVRLVLRCHNKDQAVVITTVSNYSLPCEGLAVSWYAKHEAEHDPSLIFLSSQEGIDMYMHQRLAAYARWKPVHLSAKSIAWWHYLVVEEEQSLLRDLRRWEFSHPQLSSPLSVCAA